VDEAAPGDDCWRLLVVVEKAFDRDPQPTARPPYAASPNARPRSSRYWASPILIHPDGRRTDLYGCQDKAQKRPAPARDQPLTLKLLAKKIVEWFDLASIRVESLPDASEAQVIVVLALPAALLTSRRLQECLGWVRKSCRADAALAERQPPPIVLACTEIHQATLTAQWLDSDRAARNISRAIVRRCAAPEGRLRALNWWMYHDAPDQHEAAPTGRPDREPLPRHFAGEEALGRVHPGCDLENRSKPLRVAESGNGDDQPHALLLNWRQDLPNQPYDKRLKRILQAGLPLFLLESPGLVSQPGQPQPPKEGSEHPFDGLLRRSYGEVIQTVCKHHKRLDRPDGPNGGREWHYVRHSLLYWDDHRCRQPFGAAPALGGTAGTRSDQFDASLLH
jgi:hypothetical protein